MSNYPDWWSNGQPELVKKYHLDTATILGVMSSSYWPLEAAQGENVVVKPDSYILAVYRAGSRPFGANPALFIGCPGDLTAIFGSATIGVTSSIDKFHFLGGPSAGDDLSKLTNQPLIVSFIDASVTYGPIAALTLADGGTGHSANDILTLSAGGGDATVTVLTVDGSGVILTFALTEAGTAYSKAEADQPSDSTSDGDGTGAQFTIVDVTQGNGSIDLYFKSSVLKL